MPSSLPEGGDARARARPRRPVPAYLDTPLLLSTSSAVTPCLPKVGSPFQLFSAKILPSGAWELRTRSGLSLRYKSMCPPLTHPLFLLGPELDQNLDITCSIKQLLHVQGLYSCRSHHCRLNKACLVAPSTPLTYTTRKNTEAPRSTLGQVAQQCPALSPPALRATRPIPPPEACGRPNNQSRAPTPRQR